MDRPRTGIRLQQILLEPLQGANHKCQVLTRHIVQRHIERREDIVAARSDVAVRDDCVARLLVGDHLQVDSSHRVAGKHGRPVAMEDDVDAFLTDGRRTANSMGRQVHANALSRRTGPEARRGSQMLVSTIGRGVS